MGINQVRMLNTTIFIGSLLLSINVIAAGALAIDENQGQQFGFAYDYPSIGQAEQKAINECGNNCQVVLRFESGCAAYAADQQNGATAYGWGTADSGGAAQATAIAECQARGGTACIVRSWGCNSH